MSFDRNSLQPGWFYNYFNAASLQVKFSLRKDATSIVASLGLSAIAAFAISLSGYVPMTTTAMIWTAVTFTAYFFAANRVLATLLKRHRETDTVKKDEPYWQILVAMALWVMVPVIGSIVYRHDTDQGFQLFAAMLLAGMLGGTVGLTRFFELPNNVLPPWSADLNSLTEREPSGIVASRFAVIQGGEQK